MANGLKPSKALVLGWTNFPMQNNTYLQLSSVKQMMLFTVFSFIFFRSCHVSCVPKTSDFGKYYHFRTRFWCKMWLSMLAWYALSILPIFTRGKCLALRSFIHSLRFALVLLFWYGAWWMYALRWKLLLSGLFGYCTSFIHTF